LSSQDSVTQKITFIALDGWMTHFGVKILARRLSAEYSLNEE
jgi:hypothetical protein